MKAFTCIVLLFCIGLVVSSETAMETKTLSEGEGGCSKDSQCCKCFKNCLFYQVNSDSSDYGCSQCQPNYLLTADENGAGICDKPNPIANCSLAQTDTTHDGKPYCLLCQRNYARSLDDYSCSPVPQQNRVENCAEYIVLTDLSIKCQTCDDNYTLLRNGKCQQGCTIPNCRTCATLESGQVTCNWCNAGYIGRFDETGYYYGQCFTCKDWIKSLVVAAV